MQYAVLLFPTISKGISINMTNANSNKTKCEVCGYALPLNAIICPHCGGNLILIQMIEKIPRAGSSPQQVVFPGRALGPEGANIIGVHPVVVNRKQPASPSQVLQPVRDNPNALQQGLPNRKPPAAPARVLSTAGKETIAVRQVAQPMFALPHTPAASIARRNVVRDQGGIRLPQSGDSTAQAVPQKGSVRFATRAVGASVKHLFARLPVAPMAGTQKMSGTNRFLKDWVFPVILITFLYFLFMEYMSKNYQARASESTDQQPQSTLVALGERISQAESTISAQQNTIFEMQNTIAFQQNPTLPQATLPAAPIELNKTLLLGPMDRSLVHYNDGLIKTFWAEQVTKNFILSVVQVNPYSGAFHPWDACIRFRRNYTDEYRLTIFSNQRWTLTLGLSTVPIASGTLGNLNIGEAETNAIYLEVMDGIASLKVNDVLVPAMDVSAYQGSGDVGIAIGSQKGDEVDGKTTLFQAFTLWNIP